MNPQEWKIRSAIGTDLNFIYSSWLHSYRHNSKLASSTKRKIYFKEYYGVIDWILSRPATKVSIAYSPEEPKVIFAFLVYEPDAIHYCFTRESMREMGLAASLITEAFRGDGEIQVTHQTEEVRKWMRGNSRLIYNPFRLFNQIKPTIPEAKHGQT